MPELSNYDYAAPANPHPLPNLPRGRNIPLSLPLKRLSHNMGKPSLWKKGRGCRIEKI